MIIATSGASYINYNRIFSSSSSPYSVDTFRSETFRDPTQSYSIRLYDLYIIDLNYSVALIYDNSGGQTDLATINFGNSQISYQKAFPKIINFQTALITSPTVFYAGGYDKDIFTDQTNFQTLNPSYTQSFLYSSDMTTTSCYSMAPIARSSPITMIALNTMTSLSSSIYEPSSVAFDNDTDAYTIVDINLSKLTQFPLFKINAVTQENGTFQIKAGDKNLAITYFSATAFCGASGNWTYSGVDNSNEITLNAATDLMSVDSVTGSIFVSQSKPAGTYSIKVIGTLPDLITTHSDIFTIIITANDPPYFTEEKPQNQKVMINTELKYTLPPFKDPEGSPVKISFEAGVAKSFISIQEKRVKFEPKYSFQLGTTQITIILTDEDNSSSYSFLNVTVYQRPQFTEKLQKQDIAILSYSNYSLPVNSDSKLSVLHPSSPGLPHFVKFEYPTYFFHPEKPSDLGNFIINGELCNDYTKIQFQLKVNVTNQAPYLQEGKISDLKVAIKSDYTFNFSECVDREGQKIKYEANERYKQILPSFITFTPGARQFKIKPTKLDTLKDYHIELTLIDDFNARTTYPFVVTIYDPLKQFQNLTNNSKKNQKPIAKKYLSANIKSINPQGLIIIKFFETLDSPLYINNASLKFNSTNIDIQLKPFQDQNQNKTITSWEAINLTTTQLTIQVNFSDPSLISSKISQEDKIEIIFRDGELLKSTNGQKFLPDNYVLISGIPRQIVLTKQISTISEIISAGSKAMTYLVIGNIALQLFMSFSMHLLWGMMNNLQLMGKMLKFNVNVPSNAYIFFKYIDEFLSMKAKIIEDQLEKFNQYIMKTAAKSAESEKDQNSKIIKNLGTIILGSLALVLTMISTAIMMKFQRIPLIKKITDVLKNKLFFNSILRTGVQSYLQFSIIAFASLESKKDNTTLVIGILFLCLTVFFLFFAHIFLRKNLSSLSDPNFQQRFNSLYLNIETNIPQSYLLTTIFLGRRFILGIVLSFCDDHQVAQFFYMNFTSFLIIIYLVKVKPLVSNYLNRIEIFNEVILYCCTGLVWGMTDYQSERQAGVTSEQFNAAYNIKQNRIGWAYIIMASTTIVMTIGGIIINFLILIRTKLIGKCQNQNKAVKEPIAQQPLTRNQDYALQKQDDSTMIHNKSNVSQINQKHEKNFEVQEEPKQKIDEEFKLDPQGSQAMVDREFLKEVDEEIKRQEHFFTWYNKKQLQESPSEHLIKEEESKTHQKESIFITSSEFNANFEEMKDVFKNIEVPPQSVPPPQQKTKLLLKDAFVISE